MTKHTTIKPQTQTTPAAVAAEALPGIDALKNNIFKDSLKHFPIQRKLSIGAVNDPLEEEADAMADEVMRIPATSFIQIKCSLCQVEEIQRKPLAISVTPLNQRGRLGSIIFIIKS